MKVRLLLNAQDQIRYRPKTNLASQQVGADFVVINMDTAEYHTFNRVGAVIWEAIANKKTFNEITQCITDRFDVSSIRAKEETQQFIDGLIRQGLLDKVEQ